MIKKKVFDIVITAVDKHDNLITFRLIKLYKLNNLISDLMPK